MARLRENQGKIFFWSGIWHVNYLLCEIRDAGNTKTVRWLLNNEIRVEWREHEDLKRERESFIWDESSNILEAGDLSVHPDFDPN